ncbi:hypothetical protein D3C87_1899410 [compost metagenome]
MKPKLRLRPRLVKTKAPMTPVKVKAKTVPAAMPMAKPVAAVAVAAVAVAATVATRTAKLLPMAALRLR